MGKGAAIVLSLIFLSTFSLILLYYQSATSAEICLDSLNIGTTDIVSALLSRQLSIDIYLKIYGKGLISVPVKDLLLKVYLEDIYLGTVESIGGFSIPSSGNVETVHLLATLDLSHISLSKIQTLVSTIQEYNREVKIRLTGYADVIFMIFTLSIPLSIEQYYIIGTQKPVIEVTWNATSALPGDSVAFTAYVENAYRGHELSGTLTLIVKEDLPFVADKEAQRYTIDVSLQPRMQTSIIKTFDVYYTDNLRGFFIEALWNGEKVYTMPSSYPPRLEVYQPQLKILDAYWVSDSMKVYSVKEGDLVHANVLVSAYGDFSDIVIFEVKSDKIMLPDETVISKSYSVSLSSGETKLLSLSFIAQRDPFSRGYYMKVSWKTDSWTMETSYPPRLSVVTEATPSPPTEGYLSVVDYYWTSYSPYGTQVYEVSDKTPIYAHLIIKAVGGPYTGVVKLEVRQDNIALPDITVASISKTLQLSENEQYDLCISFTAEHHFYSRGYFMRATWNNTTWEMPNSYPPRLSVHS
ncbi:MAG: hypothetical protein DRJ31_05160 [Candidatus Methanomethylicota archaeon]|uniref:Uncharacterized protein n=1 Tax=Thermoproteota archaeon TaxID=2056631 RepID=A0A497EPR0_9CREN|nr:MAG: hypothetical protein DRJ31_05160 [Candidatus Verstraetearchaeota archaeon]